MKQLNNNRGTILIWTVLLGVAMTSAFFFLATRMSGMGGITRETMEYTNQKAYLESYVDYIMSNKTSLIAGPITFDGITGTLTNEVDEITGVLDEGGSATYNFNGTINVDWNLCSNNNKETIIVDGTKHPHVSGVSCNISSPGYDDGPDTVIISAPSFTISTKGAPIYYRITNAAAGSKLPGNTWHLKASIDLGYGKKVEVEKWF